MARSIVLMVKLPVIYSLIILLVEFTSSFKPTVLAGRTRSVHIIPFMVYFSKFKLKEVSDERSAQYQYWFVYTQ